MFVTYILNGYFDRFRAKRSAKCAFLGGDFQTGVIMKSQNSFILVMLLLFAMVPCLGVRAFGGTTRSAQYYTWGIDTDTVAIPAGSIITEAVMTIRNLSSSSDSANDSLYIHLLDEPQVGFVAGTDDGSSNPFEAQGVQMVRVHHEQSQGGQDVAYTFSELAVEYSALWEHFGFPLEFGPDDQMVIESSLILDLIDYAGGGTSFGFGFDPNGNTDYDFDEITLELTAESFDGTNIQSPLRLFTKGIPGLVAHWAMNDNVASTTILDSSGNGNDGTAQQNTEDISTAGIIDGALDFNGTSDYVDCGDGAGLDFGTGDFSICMWMKTSSSLAMRLVNKRDASNIGYEITTNTSGQIRAGIGDSSGYTQGVGGTVNDNAWHHVAITYDRDGSVSLYVDAGTPSTADISIRSGSIDNSESFRIGRLRLPDKYFDGTIDDLRIFNHVLSADEIVDLYNEPAN